MTEQNNRKERKGLYARLDDYLMDRTNKVVRGWNWTTGRTKADLANLLDMGSDISFPVGGLCLGVEFPDLNYWLVPTSLILIAGGHFIREKRREIEKKEISTAKNSAKDIDVELYKESCKREAYSSSFIGGATSAFCLIPNNLPVKFGAGFMGLGALLYGGANQVMRAENYHKWEKNCLARGLDYVRELIKKPVAAPLPVQSCDLVKYLEWGK